MMNEPQHGEEDFAPSPEGVRLALLLDGQGGAKVIDWDAIQRWTPEQGGLWLQLDPRNERALAWLRDASGLSEREQHEFLHCDQRPTLRPIGERSFVFSLVRPAPNPHGGIDLVMVRGWIEPSRALSLVETPTPVTAQALALLREGRGPKSIPELVAWHVATIVSQLTLQASDLEHTIADLELAAHGEEPQPEVIWEGQARVAQLLGHIAPLKTITNRAVLSSPNWLVEDTLDTWRFAAEKARNSDQVLRNAQERSLMLHAYVSENLSLRMSSILLVLTVVSTVTLPVTLLASLFDINIGIPGRSLFGLDSSLAYVSTVGTMLLLAGLTYALLRRQQVFQRSQEGPPPSRR